MEETLLTRAHTHSHPQSTTHSPPSDAQHKLLAIEKNRLTMRERRAEEEEEEEEEDGIDQ